MKNKNDKYYCISMLLVVIVYEIVTYQYFFNADTRTSCQYFFYKLHLRWRQTKLKRNTQVFKTKHVIKI